MMGPPGCGKTMLAMRLPGLLPAADGDAPCLAGAPASSVAAVRLDVAPELNNVGPEACGPPRYTRRAGCESR